MEVLSVRRYKAGYEIRTERHWWGSDGEPTIIKPAYTMPEGHYIGSSRLAHQLIVQRGIKPEKVKPNDTICTIGFCEREQRWYGWSHRPGCSFGIGDVVEEGDVCASSGRTDEHLAEHPEDDTSLPVGFTANSLEDAKMMAVVYADAVG